MSIRSTRDEILAFWFENAPDMNKWFMKSRDFDEYIRTEFSSTLERGEELVDWADTPSGFVALIVLLDQFSRQIWRGSPKAFAYDALALRVATSKLDEHYPQLQRFERMFAIMPLMHAEDANAQTRCVLMVEEEAADGDPFWKNVLEHAKGHFNVVERFGRFPKRNAVLGRETTPEEQAYIDETPNLPY